MRVRMQEPDQDTGVVEHRLLLVASGVRTPFTPVAP